MPIRIQRKRTKGWRLPENTICVDRSTYWGNPYKIGDDYNGVKIDAAWAVRLYGAAIEARNVVLKFTKDELWKLRGKNLACFCPLDQPCHADVLLELANADPTGE